MKHGTTILLLASSLAPLLLARKPDGGSTSSSGSSLARAPSLGPSQLGTKTKAKPGAKAPKGDPWAGTGYAPLGGDSRVGHGASKLLGLVPGGSSGAKLLEGAADSADAGKDPTHTFPYGVIHDIGHAFGVRWTVPYIDKSEYPTYFAGGAGLRGKYTHTQWRDIQKHSHLQSWDDGTYKGPYSQSIWNSLKARGALPRRFYTHDEWRAILAAEG